MARRQMSVKWRNAGGQALKILKDAGVKNLEPTTQGASFEFDDNADALDGLLKILVVEGVRVTEWRGSGDDLEQIFLQSGARELM
jgi:hypothetical protein